MDAKESEMAKRWVKTWKEAGPWLEEVKRDELRALTDEQAMKCSMDLLSSADNSYYAPHRLRHSGLEEQQRLFKKLHP